jgi:hypothetical protein
MILDPVRGRDAKRAQEQSSNPDEIKLLLTQLRMVADFLRDRMWLLRDEILLEPLDRLTNLSTDVSESDLGYAIEDLARRLETRRQILRRMRIWPVLRRRGTWEPHAVASPTPTDHGRAPTSGRSIQQTGDAHRPTLPSRKRASKLKDSKTHAGGDEAAEANQNASAQKQAEDAALFTLSERLYGSWAFRIAWGAFLLAAVFAIGGTIVIGGQELKLSAKLDAEAEKALQSLTRQVEQAAHGIQAKNDAIERDQKVLSERIASAQLDFGRFRRRGRVHFAFGARYGVEFRCCLGAAGT